MPDQLSRRHLLQAATGTLVGAAWPAVAQGDWPTRPVRLFTATAAGDANDLIVRRFAQSASAELNGQSFVVENRPGAGGVLAHQEFLRNPADGYTVLHGNASIGILPSVSRKLSYNPLTDMQPVAFLGWNVLGLAIPASRPEKTFGEWVAWARQQKGKLNYGSSGSGSIQHLYGWQLSDQLGLEAVHIAHRGMGPALRDMIGEQLQYAVVDIFTLRTFAANNQLRILAVTGAERTKFLPDVPTFKEMGVSNFERMGWNAWYLKAGTPQHVVDRLSMVTNRISAAPEWTALRNQMWVDWRPLQPPEVVAQVRRETEAWAQVVKKSGYVPE